MIDYITDKLKTHIEILEDPDEWLFVAINTMKAIVDNSCKEEVSIVLKAQEYDTTAEIKQMYDMIQGKYGREGFSYRNNPAYFYLSSLIARFPDCKLDQNSKEKIVGYYNEREFLLYRI